ncbi:hypothetical protein JR316_0002834 [Psilocybe cubensis]|uniref:Uncharacterized protein n=1 Tax=Psilocybe cubensis TaxID=181762 RepID=A0ACB8HE33_PSICU|nr:hypothetical protein JR316_0002834 [Psilocybe cubensis]KAH9485917.1 hypothetical protein JR316_0002834 [Psilocybe cubensis]
MVQAVAAFLDFCYLVRRNVIDDDTLDQIEAALSRFHHHREIFRDLNIRPEGFSLPRQHSLTHYPTLIRLFGAPNGLCSSITENKHIKAVKKPYRRSSRYKALGQMLVTNQRIDKLLAARVFFTSHSMLNSVPEPFNSVNILKNVESNTPPSTGALGDLGDGRKESNEECGEIFDPESQSEISLAKSHVRGVPLEITAFAFHVKQPRLAELTQQFLYDQLVFQNADLQLHIPPNESLPSLSGCTFRLFTSARAVYFAPSDLSGSNGLYYEMIRSTSSWRKGPARRDCVFIGNSDSDADGFAGLHVARVFLFFSFKYAGTIYPCALVQWFSHIGDKPCPVTGMWKVKPDLERRDQRHGQRRRMSVVHLDSIYRGAHLIGDAGKDFIPLNTKFDFSKSLDSFRSFYVNKYVDHHAHEIAF